MAVLAFPSKRKIAVLCVDDEPTALLVRRTVLEKAGFRVSAVSTAAEAMNLVANEQFDLVLTDYYLQGSTGGELARSIKDVRPLLPVAIYSGAADLPEDTRYADAVLTKAGGVDDLVESIRRLATALQRAA